MEDSTVNQMGFAIHKSKTKNRICKSAGSKGGYETASLRQRTNRAALEYFQEPLETALIRHHLYQEHWIRFNSTINNFEQTWLDDLTKKVAKFVKGNVKLRTAASREDENIGIPIGIIVTEEKRGLMSTVLQEILNSVEFLLVRVSSSKCPNVKSAFQNIAKQLINSNHNVSRFVETRMEDSDELEDSMAEEAPGRKQSYLSIYDVNSWYKSGKVKPHIIIVLDDVDMFPERVASDLVQLLSCLKVNFTLLLGLTSQFVSITKFLPSTLHDDCNVKMFVGADPKEQLDEFMDQVLYNLSSPFRLSGGIVRLLRNYFLQHNFSMTRLLQAYQICLMEHFRKPESLFCSWDIGSQWNSQQFLDLGQDEFLESVASLSEAKGLRDKRKCRSPSKSPAKKGRVFFNEETKKETQQKLKQCYNEILGWYEALILLYQFGKGLPERPIGETKLDLYISASTGFLHEEPEFESSPFDKLLRMVQTFSAIEMERRLDKALDEIKDFHKSNASSKLFECDLDRGIPEALGNLILSIHEAKAMDMAAQEASTLMEKEPIVFASQYPRRKTKRLHETGYVAGLEKLTRVLNKDIAEKKTQKSTAFHKVRDGMIRFLKGSVGSTLKKLTEIPCAQVFVFDDIEFLHKQLFPNLPKDIHLALCLPQKYLHCHCCEDTLIGSNDSSLPDTSILYKLLLEQTHHVLDLNALYTAFKSFHVPVQPKRRTSVALKKAKEEEDRLLSRFAKSYAELQFLGFMKRNKRKPDEATKLSWIFSN